MSGNGGLNSVHVLGLQALRTLLDLELNLRTFIQAPVPVCLNGREMHEHVVAAGALDKSIAFGGIKPLHNTFFFHYKFSYNIVRHTQKECRTTKKLRRKTLVALPSSHVACANNHLILLSHFLRSVTGGSRRK